MTVATDTLWDDLSYWSEPAEQAFAKARRAARRERLLDRIMGRAAGLASFDEAVGGTRLLPESSTQRRSIQIAEIVGSVGKSSLFTRSFLPKSNRLKRRWKRAFAVAHGLRGYQSIELYEVAGSFYVVDGHFRVSVARVLGFTTIQALVRRWS
ncbi:MAG: hypothetical protein QNJ77_10445 [Acidimicrobiia bacterium]|nr:hypothetical protein [Acidimicrobiia bacterium]